MSDSLINYQAGIVQTLGATGGFTHVLGVGGQFGPKDLQRIAVAAPAAAVSIEAADLAVRGNSPWATIGTAIVLAAKGDEALPRHTQILRLVGLTIQALMSPQIWGLDTVTMERPLDVQSENLYTPELDKSGVALWLVTFEQTVDLIDLATLNLDDFLHFHADYKLGEGLEILAQDDVTYDYTLVSGDGALDFENENNSHWLTWM